MARRVQHGFTLVEALVSLTIIAMSAAALLLAVETTVQTRSSATNQAVALGLARQLLDEILGLPYHAPSSSPTQAALGAASLGGDRTGFDEIGDYNGYVAQSVVDPWGVALGQDDGQGGVRTAAAQASSLLLSNLREEVFVYYVSDSDPSVRLPGGQTSSHRAIEVRISEVDSDGSVRELVRLRQVVAYVPSTT